MQRASIKARGWVLPVRNDLGRTLGQGHEDLDPGTHSLHTLQCQRTAHELGQGTADDQAQPSALARTGPVDLYECIEQACLVRRAYADTRIAHTELDALEFALYRGAHRGVDFTTVGELDRIADQVRQHLLQARSIYLDPDRFGG